MMLVSGWFVAFAVLADAQTPPDPTPLEEEKLEAEINKLNAEIDKIDAETDRDRGFAAALLRIAPLLTAVGAALGVVITWNKQVNDSRVQRRGELQRQKDKDREDRHLREQDLQQRERERLQRFDELLTRTLEKLGSTDTATQAMGAASLRAFLQPHYKDMVPDVLDIIRTNLKLERDPIVHDVLRLAFERALRLCVAEAQELDARLDLTGTHLARVNLEGIDLRGLQLDVAFADLAHANLTHVDLRRILGFRTTLDDARLSRANLQEARLNEAKCNRTHFHGANLVSATLKDAQLVGAEFRQARLQSAHLEGAALEGARFEEGRVSDAYFTGATLDDAALRSITNARGWRTAHFDPPVAERLEQISAQRAGLAAEG